MHIKSDTNQLLRGRDQDHCKETLTYQNIFLNIDVSTVTPLGKLKNSISNGSDGIPNFLVKQMLHNLIKPLTYLVNLLFCCGVFPDNLNFGKVIPIHKKRKWHGYKEF